jgi:DNA-binding MarR family transcriptional regulator
MMKHAKTVSEEANQFALERFLPYRLSLLSNTVSEGIAIAYRKPHGLSVTEWRVVAVLGRFPDQTASEIVKRTAMDKVAVSRAVKGLQQRGLVERKPFEGDRRLLPLRLTSRKGRPLFRKVVPEALAYEHALLSALNHAEQEQLDGLLGKLQEQASNLNRSVAC